MGEIFNEKEIFWSKFFETSTIKVPILFIFLKILFLFLDFNQVAFYFVWIGTSFLVYFCELNERRVFND